MSVENNILEIKRDIPAHVTLVAVSKTHPVEAIMEAYGVGQRIFGESRPQELVTKAAVLPQNIEWHMIGHLQRNKVRMIMPFVAMIHSVDSARLLETIEAEAAYAGRKVDVLLEMHVASEESKHGWNAEELRAYLEGGQWRGMEHIRFRGLMGIATNTPDERVVRGEFDGLRELCDALRREYFDDGFDTLSMGMTSDWRAAVECGSTMVRIGSLIFGDRDYGTTSK